MSKQGSEREGKRIPGKTGSTIVTSVRSLLGSSTKGRRKATVLTIDHQNSVQKESAPSESDARRWKRNLSSLMVKGGDTRLWVRWDRCQWHANKEVWWTKHTIVHTKCRVPVSRHGRGHVRPCLVEKPHPSWLSQRVGVLQDLSRCEGQEGPRRSCFCQWSGGARFSGS